MTLLVISPHLDDGVLSCGALLAAQPGAVVLTVFAGTPRDGGMCTDWDRRCGFRDAAEAMAVRRHEDDRALDSVGAAGLRLGFGDAQYGDTPAVEQVVQALLDASVNLRDGTLLYPLGLFDDDHLLVHDAVRGLLREQPDRAAFAYEDVPYRAMSGLLQQRLDTLARRGLVGTPVDPGRGTPRNGIAARAKAAAVALYESQGRPLGPSGLVDAERPERFWALHTADLAA